MKVKRKKRMQWILIIVLAVFAIHLVSMLTLDRTIEYTQTTYSSTAVSAQLNGYKIAFLSDTHSIRESELLDIVEQLNKWQPDILLLGGDMGNREGSYAVMEQLGQVRAADGRFGVDGNHDDADKLYVAMRDAGITPLPDTGQTVRDGLYIAGVRDFWNYTPNVAAAIKNAHSEDFTLLISHNPDVSMEFDTTGVDIMLSGHTHGGQVTLFGLWAPALAPQKSITAYGQKFMHGWATGAYGTQVFTSRGAGELRSVPRVFARPEVVLLTLHSEQ